MKTPITMDTIEDWANGIAFFCRERIWGDLPLRQGLPATSTIAGERGYYLSLLQRAFENSEIRTRSLTEVWDVGCRNWSYVGAIAHFFQRARLIGVELDGRRRHWNLYRRMDYADAHAKLLRGKGRDVEAICGDFLEEISRKESLAAEGAVGFCFFYPYVSLNPCLKGGLPSKYSEFSPLLERAIGLAAARGGFILSVHQGEWEAEVARESYSRLGLKPRESVLSASETAGYWPAPYDAYLFLVPISTQSASTS